MSDYVTAALAKLESAGAHPLEIAAFRRRLELLDGSDDTWLDGADLQPVDDLPELEGLPAPDAGRTREVLDQLVVIKLNGGLGTGMGLTGAKSLLEVKPGMTFLDVIASQMVALRERHDARLPLVLMNSEHTQGPSLEVLRRHSALVEQAFPLDFLQSKEPKLRTDDRMPVEWSANPDLEWCPPGHGDLYTSISASGVLDTLLDAGLRYAFISNSDNLGALVDVRIAAWMADNEVPFAMEAARRTEADRKGGHLALRNGQLILRESAQVPDGDDSFGDTDRWRYFNTNNLWIDLRVLKQMQADDPSSPHLPLIVNGKTVDPRDKNSTKVLQLETAMGAAVGSIPGARAVAVPRSRFAPVKTTNDMLVVRSDAYEVAEDGEMRATYDGPGPVVTLDGSYYKVVSDLEARFPSGVPSLRNCTRLEVEGDVTFGANVVVEGAVKVTGPARIADGEVLKG